MAGVAWLLFRHRHGWKSHAEGHLQTEKDCMPARVGTLKFTGERTYEAPTYGGISELAEERTFELPGTPSYAELMGTPKRPQRDLNG
jgi:hypothetical protein